MRKIRLSLLAATVLVAGMSSMSYANPLEEIFSDGKYCIQIRPRYEFVDQDGKSKNANAFTVRTALSAQVGLLGVEGLGAQIQMINVANFGNEKYNPNPANADISNYPVVVDPDQTRVTQANISYSANGFVGIVGRKMVVLDNARFIGNVGWRQMPQTYDLAAVIYNGIENLSLLGAYVNRVHRVTDNGKIDSGSVLLHASYKVMPELTITAYDYMIQNFADHIGIRATGTIELDMAKLKYTAEYAKQTDPTMTDDDDTILPIIQNLGVTDPDNIDQDSDYYNIAIDATIDAFIVGLGYEVLGDDGNKAKGTAFYTPLATLHAMNGWADKFLGGTPANGLADFTIKVGYDAGEFGKLVAIYHNYESDKGSIDYGTEVDVAYKYKIAKNLGLLLKGAWYDADKHSVDTTKYWVQLDYKFKSE